MLNELLCWVVNHLSFIGSMFQVVGSIFMANTFFHIKYKHVPRAFFSAIFRGNYADKVARIGKLHDEDKTKSLQGLSYIFLGFLLQSIKYVLDNFF
jgi:hypothetical protein